MPFPNDLNTCSGKQFFPVGFAKVFNHANVTKKVWQYLIKKTQKLVLTGKSQ